MWGLKRRVGLSARLIGARIPHIVVVLVTVNFREFHFTNFGEYSSTSLLSGGRREEPLRTTPQEGDQSFVLLFDGRR